MTDPALLTSARLESIERGVHENAREPDLKRQLAAILLDVQEHLDEGILHGLVGVGGVAQILERDPQRPALQQRHQRPEPIARLVLLSLLDEALDLSRQNRRRRRMGRVGRSGLLLRAEVSDGLSCHVHGVGDQAVLHLVTTPVSRQQRSARVILTSGFAISTIDGFDAAGVWQPVWSLWL